MAHDPQSPTPPRARLMILGYPTDYREITHNLMTAFPVIQRCLGLTDKAAQETVLTKLRTKFRNERKKRPASPTQSPAPAKRPKVEQKVDGLPNFYPAPASSHVPVMETEKKLNKLRFDESLEDDERDVLLAETLPARRAAILTMGAKAMSLKRLKEMFPFIFGEEQLWKEVGLLVGEPVKSKYEAKLSAALDCLAKEVGCPRDMAAETLLRLLEEEALVRDDQLTKPGPCILVKQGEDDGPVLYQIYLEGLQVARCGCLDSGLLVLAIACYIFNQVVRKSNRGLMWLMARGVMGLSAETKPTSRAVDLMAAFGLKE